MPIDPNIAMQVRPIELADPMQQYGRAVQLKSLIGQGDLQALQMQEARRGAEEARAYNDSYREAIGADGTVDRTRLLSSLAQRGVGSKIPSVTESFAKADKLGLETKKLQGDVDAQKLGTVREQIKALNGGLGALMRKPDLSHQDVIQTVGALAAQGLITPEQGQEAIRQMPGNPAALPQFLQGRLLSGVEADKMITLMLPKLQQVNDGQRTLFVDTNPLSNPAGPAPIQMQATPDAVMRDGTTRSEGAANRATQVRGQNMTDTRARELAVATREAAATGRIPSGYQRTADGTGLEFIPGGPADPARERNSPPTEDERKAASWLDQATNAYKNMLGVLDANPNAAKPAGGILSAAGSLVQSLPIIGQTDIAQGVGNFIKPSDRLKFEQSTGSMSEALLRAATGAGVNRDEARQKVREITPVFGDDDATIKQKLDSIPVYLESLKTRAGRAAPKDYAVPGAGAAAAGGARPPLSAFEGRP